MLAAGCAPSAAPSAASAPEKLRVWLLEVAGIDECFINRVMAKLDDEEVGSIDSLRHLHGLPRFAECFKALTADKISKALLAECATTELAPAQAAPTADRPRAALIDRRVYAVEAFSDDDDADEAAIAVETEIVAPDGKRKRQHMTAAEAKAQALREGLVLVTSSVSSTGYTQVVCDGRKGNPRYAAYKPGRRCKGALLGCFATAEEAALAYARHTDNRTPLVIHGAGHSQGTRDARDRARGYTLVCQSPGCAALVDYVCANRGARGCKRMTYAAGDGCAAPGCSADFRRSKFVPTQQAMAAALLNGERTLIEWPAKLPPQSYRERTEPVPLSGEAVRSAAAVAAARAASLGERRLSPRVSCAGGGRRSGRVAYGSERESAYGA